MGILLSSLWSLLWPQRPSKVLIVGLDNAGKARDTRKRRRVCGN